MAPKAMKKPAGRSRSPRSRTVVPTGLGGMKAFVVNLERRPDRWTRCSKMLKKELPWLEFERFLASDGTQNPIPEEDIAAEWNTCRNAGFADYYEWVYDAPGSDLDGKFWEWSCEAQDETDDYTFKEHSEEEFSYITHVPCEHDETARTGILFKKATKESFKVRLQFAREWANPGKVQRMSGGERGCAHSHLRLWRLAAERSEPTLCLEDDVQLCFNRSGNLGLSSGKVFTQRLRSILQHVPSDWDVIYLGWGGWRGGHYRHWKADAYENPETDGLFRRAEYIWTTVAYVISQAGARKLLAAGVPLNQPVDNFMAWEANQGRLNSYVALDTKDDDNTWSGGIADQLDFAGDSDIKKSDGGHQGDDEKEFAVDP